MISFVGKYLYLSHMLYDDIPASILLIWLYSKTAYYISIDHRYALIVTSGECMES